MKKKLALKSEYLSELTAEDLRLAIGASYSGNPFCILSATAPCHTYKCTENLECILHD